MNLTQHNLSERSQQLVRINRRKLTPIFADRSDANRQESGAVLVELVLVFPLVLACIFFLLWFGMIINLRESFFNAVSEGVTIAATRGDFALMGRSSFFGLIPAVDQYYEVGGSAGRVLNLLSTPDIADDLNSAGAVINRYNAFMHNIQPVDRIDSVTGQPYSVSSYPSSATLTNAPREVLYALVYISQYMKRSAGAFVKFPCYPDPDNAGADGTAAAENGPGCMRCQLMPLEEMGAAGCVDPTSGCNYQMNDAGIALDRIGVECIYAPQDFFFGPMFTLLGAGDAEQGVTFYAKQWIMLSKPEFCLRNRPVLAPGDTTPWLGNECAQVAY